MHIKVLLTLFGLIVLPINLGAQWVISDGLNKVRGVDLTLLNSPLQDYAIPYDISANVDIPTALEEGVNYEIPYSFASLQKENKNGVSLPTRDIKPLTAKGPEQKSFSKSLKNISPILKLCQAPQNKESPQCKLFLERLDKPRNKTELKNNTITHPVKNGALTDAEIKRKKEREDEERRAHLKPLNPKPTPSALPDPNCSSTKKIIKFLTSELLGKLETIYNSIAEIESRSCKGIDGPNQPSDFTVSPATQITPNDVAQVLTAGNQEIFTIETISSSTTIFSTSSSAPGETDAITTTVTPNGDDGTTPLPPPPFEIPELVGPTPLVRGVTLPQRQQITPTSKTSVPTPIPITTTTDGFLDAILITARSSNINITDPSSRANVARNLQGLIAYYPFDTNFLNYANNATLTIEKTAYPTDPEVIVDNGNSANRILGTGALSLRGKGGLEIPEFIGFEWKSHFTISLWFKRTDVFNSYATLISNGYADKSSFEIRLGRELSGQRIGAGIITKDKHVTWDYSQSFAKKLEWHHVVLTYDGHKLSFYLDNEIQRGNAYCCAGPVISNNNPLKIGTTGYGAPFGINEDFYGYIDELAIYNRTLDKGEVSQLYEIDKKSAF